jgi:hypothetical protein
MPIECNSSRRTTERGFLRTREIEWLKKSRSLRNRERRWRMSRVKKVKDHALAFVVTQPSHRENPKQGRRIATTRSFAQCLALRFNVAYPNVRDPNVLSYINVSAWIAIDLALNYQQRGSIFFLHLMTVVFEPRCRQGHLRVLNTVTQPSF